ncbi:MAG: NAD(P)H-hydrate dehydratase [Sphingomonadales bacterium]
MHLNPKYAILTADQMIKAEIATFKSGIAAFTLMLSAGSGLVKAILVKKKPGKILFLNGPGNNGGDGWVAAELLRRRGWDVHCVALKLPDGKRLCAATEAYKKYQGDKGDFPNNINDFDVIVDALFGTGLQRNIEGKAGDWIMAANEAKAFKVAVDIPSGISSDNGQILGTAFVADLTVAFSHKKRGHMVMPGLEYAGEVVTHDIGISEKAILDVAPTVFENAPALWRGDLPKPQKGAYKHKRGHLLVIGGGVEMSGAARMAARSALRAGAGLVTTLAPKEAISAYAENQLSVMSKGYGDEKAFSEAIKDKKFNAFVIGPGHGVGEGTKDKVLQVLATGKPCVLDADALTSFEGDTGAFEGALHKNCVITPHFGEFKRLWPDIDWTDKIAAAEEVAGRTGSVCLLKGPDTVISNGKTTIINTHASPHLATAGSGDVLAGIIAGFQAQGLDVFSATAIGAWIHGDVSLTLGPGLIADDLIEGIPEVLKKFTLRD